MIENTNRYSQYAGRLSGARAFVERLGDLASQPWFAYGTLILLQLKVMWNIWAYHDLTDGDESRYFNLAYLWYTNHSVDIAWSPLYTSLTGLLLHFSQDAYFIVTVHRIIVVLVLDILILMLMRRLLPHSVAWLIAAWWAVLPVNFSASYTVHLFAAIPVLASWLLILYRPAPWARGAALAMMLVTGILVRNEHVVTTVILALVCICWELSVVKGSATDAVPRRITYVLSYGLPLLVAGIIIVFFYTRSISKLPEILTANNPKHTVNMCQVYAFGYQQRHPEWNKSPWLECSDLMQSTFGKPLPTLMEMLKSNPSAVLTHVAWNMSLTPSGVQKLLFNAASGTVNPDYAGTVLHSATALILSLIMGVVWFLGLFILIKERGYWWQHWLKERALGWLAMLTTLPVAFLIIATQRPRPEYLFNQGLILMAITGMAVFVITRHWSLLKPVSMLLPIAVAALLFIVPSIYEISTGSRPLLKMYERLAPFSEEFSRSNTKFLVSRSTLAIHGYVAHTIFTNPFVHLDYSILDAAPEGERIDLFLARQGVNVFYIDEAMWERMTKNPLYQPFLRSPAMFGWKILAYQNSGDTRWMLVQKTR
jgi:hypothetical protein